MAQTAIILCDDSSRFSRFNGRLEFVIPSTKFYEPGPFDMSTADAAYGTCR